MDKKELNAGRYLTTCFLVSVVLGLILAGNSGGALSYVLTAVVIAIVAFFCLFWIGAIVAAVCGMSITGGRKGSLPRNRLQQLPMPHRRDVAGAAGDGRRKKLWKIFQMMMICTREFMISIIILSIFHTLLFLNA